MATQPGEDSLLQFNPKLPKLSTNEKKVLDLLVEAGKLIAPIYNEQEKWVQEGGFYPEGVSREEVKGAIEEDPAILSPYTVVEKVDGKLVAVPYHIKYAKLLKPIADKLEEASRVTRNEEFSGFLKLQAKALMDGTYEEAIEAWLKMKPHIIDVSIGPVEHHDDRLFFAKASYQAWVGVINQNDTDRLNRYKESILGVDRKGFTPHQKLENHNNVKAKVDDVVLFSGHMAKTKFVGVNMPMNLELVEKYGSEVTLFNQVNDLRFKEQILPMFKKIFSPAFKKGFNEEDLRRGNLRYIALHELAHNFLYYKNAPGSLQDLLSPIYELSATVLGLRMAGSLLLKEMINSKQLESMIVAFICRSFYLIEKSKKAKFWVNYAVGGAIFINFLLESGALKESGGLAIANFTKIFLALQDLSFPLEYLLSYGTREGAAAFIGRYGQFKI